MSKYEDQYNKIRSLIFKDYRELCKYLAFGNEKVESSLLEQSNVDIEFSELNCNQKIELAEKVLETNEFNLEIDNSFLLFGYSDDWTISLQNNKDDESKKEFIELVESWKLNISLPSYIEELFLSDDFEERFEGILYFFSAEIINDYNFSDILRRNYFEKILDEITDTINYYDEILLNSNKLPLHLRQTYSILRKEYHKAYRLVFKKFKTQISGFYNFENKLINKDKKYLPKEKNYFSLCKGLELTNDNFRDLKDALGNRGYINNSTNYITLKNAFTSGSNTKINWLGGKDRLGFFIYKLKKMKIIRGQAHSVAKNIFILNGDPIKKLRTPHSKNYNNYKDEFEKIINNLL